MTLLGERLREVRKAAGLRPEQLASKAGVAFTTVYRIERGSTLKPHTTTLRAFEQVLGVGVHETSDGHYEKGAA